MFMWKPGTLDHSPPSEQPAWNSQRLFSLADGKYSSVEPQDLTDTTTIFPPSVWGSQVREALLAGLGMH